MRGKNYNAGLRGVLFEAHHYARMGQAVWLFGWVLLRETRDRGGIGFVLGGRPITYREIEEETGFARKSLERWMRILRRGGYIETTTAPSGIIVRIQKAKKFDRKVSNRAQENFQQGSKSSVDNLWESQVNSSPLLRFAVSPSKSEASPPQNCASVLLSGAESTRLPRGISSGAIERQIENRRSASDPARENCKSVGEKFVQGNSNSAANRFPSYAQRASRSEDVSRELRVGSGPEALR